MFNKKTILKILKLASKHRQGFYDKRTTHPVREWMVGLLVFAAVILLGSLQSAHIFLNYQNVNTEEGVFQEQIAEYSRPLAEKALSIYLKRKDAFLLLQKNSAPNAEIISELGVTDTTSTPVIINDEIEATATEETVSGGAELVN